MFNKPSLVTLLTRLAEAAAAQALNEYFASALDNYVPTYQKAAEEAEAEVRRLTAQIIARFLLKTLM